MMQEEAVSKRQWLTSEEFSDLLGAVNLLPGPASTKMAIFVGCSRAGWFGGLISGICTTLPATLMMLPLAWAYLRYGGMPQVAAIFAGMRPVIVVILLEAIIGLGRTSLRSVWLAALAFAACLAGVNPLLVVAACAAISVGIRVPKLLSIEPVALSAIFAAFLKIGAVVFGSGYVLLAFFRTDLVDRLHWLSEGQLLDAVAAGQITPGPTFASATFIGYLLAGLPGSMAATVAVFMPSFVLAIAGAPLLEKIRDAKWAQPFLDGLNSGAIALMAVVCYDLGRAAIASWFGAALMLITSALVWKKVNPVWAILMGSAAGLIKNYLHFP